MVCELIPTDLQELLRSVIVSTLQRHGVYKTQAQDDLFTNISELIESLED